MLLRQKDYAGALAEFRIYQGIAEETLPRAPNNGSLLYDVANAQQKVGDALREKGDLGGAMTAYQTALKIAAELAGRNMTTDSWKKTLAMNYHRIGLVLVAQGDRQGAVAQFRQCLAVPVNKFVWTPRDRWPADVTAACRAEIDRLNG